MFSWQPIPGENWLMTHRHSLTLTSSTLLLSRERPKISVYSQSSVVHISVYSVNHVLLLCVCEREVPICVFSDQFTLQPCCLCFWKKCSLQEIGLNSSQAFPLSNFWLLAIQSKTGWLVGRPGNEASKRCCSPMVLCSPVPDCYSPASAKKKKMQSWDETRFKSCHNVSSMHVQA